ncbi:MAG: response regulator transcription factor [Anaerolineae bacterium]|nr:response regulator transcription factor [Anaerolineae bacterium]
MIADDHPMFRKGLGVLLKSLSKFEIVAEAENGTAVVSLAQQIQPDVILMDVQMPELNGIEATRQILRHSPHIAVLMITMYQDDNFVFAAMRAGARGYLLKGADQDEIVRAIETASCGGAIFSPSIASRMKTYFDAVKPARPDDLFPELTEREIEVLDLIAQGYNNAEIAERLVLSNKTVRNHVSNVLSKLQVADRAHAIRRGREAGLGQDDTERAF